MHLFNAMKHEEIRVVPGQSVEIKIKRQYTSKLSKGRSIVLLKSTTALIFQRKQINAKRKHQVYPLANG